MLNMLKRLTGAFGVSGNEECIREVIRSEVADYVDEILVDPLGNLIAVKKGTGKKIMIAAHMDEIGIIVTHVDKKGFLRFSNIGWVDPHCAIGQRVVFKNGTVGVVHYENKLKDIEDLELSTMYIDIGEKSKDSAKKKIKIGDTAFFEGRMVEQGDMLICNKLDNRSGCAILIEVLKKFPKTNNEVYFTFTVQEEIGLRGAKTSAYSIKPDLALVVDVTDTGDTPECEIMEVSCGKGPAIKIKDRAIICHPEIRRSLESVAKEYKIPYQLEIMEYGATDAGVIHLTAGGIPTGGVSIPCRYVHTPSEMVSISDMNNAIELIKKFLRTVK